MHVNPDADQTIPLLRLLVSPHASVGGHGPGVAGGSSSIHGYHFIPVGHRSMVRDGPLEVLINQVANARGDSQHRTGCGGGLQSSLSRSPTVENGAWPRKQEFVLNQAGNSPPPSVFFGPRRFYAKSDFLYWGLESCGVF